ncbi:MAG: hypothetical protein JSU96_01915, partial [Acidobacteriota bacterium]
SVILINNTTETTVGQVEFFASDGNVMPLTAGGSEGSAFEFTIPAGGVYRLTTDAAGTLQAGWARVTMDQPIEGTALYTLDDDQGNLQTEVGVSSAALQQEFILIADSIGQANTGIALVNPVPESERRTISLDLDLYAHDQAGRTAGVSLQLDSMNHKAVFFNELFEWVPDIGEFEGVIRVTSWDYVAPVSLRQAGTKLTALPIMPRQRGFAPPSELIPSQSLPGQAPSYRWTLRQAAGDFGIRQLQLQASGLQLNTGNLSPLQKIGYGYIAGGGYDLGGGQSRTVDLVLVRTDPVELDIVEIGEFDEISVVGSGVMTPHAGNGVTIDLNLFSAPFSYSMYETVTHFYFPPGVFRSPETAGQHGLTTHLSSVSTRPGFDRFTSIVDEQNILTQQASTELMISQVEPVFPMASSVLTIMGSGFGDSPIEVEFPTFRGNREKVPAQAAGPNTLHVLAPERLADGQITLWKGEESSNPYDFVTLFSPQFKVESGSSSLESGNQISLVIEQEPGQFAVYWFEINLFGLNCDIDDLSVGSPIGKGLWKPEEQWDGDHYELKVESVEEGKARIGMFRPGYGYPESSAFMMLEPLNEGVGVRLTLDRQYPDVRTQMLREFFHQSWSLSGPSFDWPSNGRVTALARLKSTPIETGDMLSSLMVEKAGASDPD